MNINKFTSKETDTLTTASMFFLWGNWCQSKGNVPSQCASEGVYAGTWNGDWSESTKLPFTPIQIKMEGVTLLIEGENKS